MGLGWVCARRYFSIFFSPPIHFFLVIGYFLSGQERRRYYPTKLPCLLSPSDAFDIMHSPRFREWAVGGPPGYLELFFFLNGDIWGQRAVSHLARTASPNLLLKSVSSYQPNRQTCCIMFHCSLFLVNSMVVLRNSAEGFLRSNSPILSTEFGQATVTNSWGTFLFFSTRFFFFAGSDLSKDCPPLLSM